MKKDLDLIEAKDTMLSMLIQNSSPDSIECSRNSSICKVDKGCRIIALILLEVSGGTIGIILSTILWNPSVATKWFNGQTNVQYPEWKSITTSQETYYNAITLLYNRYYIINNLALEIQELILD